MITDIRFRINFMADIVEKIWCGYLGNIDGTKYSKREGYRY
jgi:hypothetical protein